MDFDKIQIDINKVIALRIKSGLRSAEVARRVGIRRSLYADYESQRLRLPSNILARLCALYDVPVEAFTSSDPKTEKIILNLPENFSK